ncbi:hypothetical protein J921_2160 [Acinetobacter baumannii 25493_8]|nr:hypothetical protein J921_2160 [Acinetobacter baumannii 25493_8]EYD54275.1 hypothetical protein J916_3042 [Acinetobacter baumannii 25493_3]EYS53259.1 hypothetical protein K007_0283 [Acinetobacter baumannii 25569_1]
MPLSVLEWLHQLLFFGLYPVNPGLADWQLLFLTLYLPDNLFDRGLSPYDGSPVAFQDLKHALGMAVFPQEPTTKPHIVRRVLDVLLELRNGNKLQITPLQMLLEQVKFDSLGQTSHRHHATDPRHPIEWLRRHRADLLYGQSRAGGGKPACYSIFFIVGPPRHLVGERVITHCHVSFTSKYNFP